MVTPGFFLVALDAKTGQPISDFGTNGIVDAMLGLGFEVDPETGIDPKYGLITTGSPPIVINGVVCREFTR